MDININLEKLKKWEKTDGNEAGNFIHVNPYYIMYIEETQEPNKAIITFTNGEKIAIDTEGKFKEILMTLRGFQKNPNGGWSRWE